LPLPLSSIVYLLGSHWILLPLYQTISIPHGTPFHALLPPVPLLILNMPSLISARARLLYTACSGQQSRTEGWVDMTTGRNRARAATSAYRCLDCCTIVLFDTLPQTRNSAEGDAGRKKGGRWNGGVQYGLAAGVTRVIRRTETTSKTRRGCLRVLAPNATQQPPSSGSSETARQRGTPSHLLLPWLLSGGGALLLRALGLIAAAV